MKMGSGEAKSPFLILSGLLKWHIIYISLSLMLAGGHNITTEQQQNACYSHIEQKECTTSVFSSS